MGGVLFMKPKTKCRLKKIFQKRFILSLIFILFFSIVSLLNMVNVEAVNEDEHFNVVSGDVMFEDIYEIPDYMPAIEGGRKWGKRIDFLEGGSSIEFKTKIALSGDRDDNLLKLVMVPEESFVEGKKAELRDFKIKVSENGNPDNYFELIVDGSFDNFQSVGLVSTAAKASNQTVFGGHDSSKNHLRTPRSGNINKFSFAGVTGNLLDISYNNSTTTLKALPMYDSYGDIVRVFNRVYELPENPDNRYVAEDVCWEGFSENSEVTITITAGNLINSASKATMVIFEVGGIELVNSIQADVKAYGIEGEKYPLPEAKVVTTTQQGGFIGNYTVKAPDNTIIKSGEYQENTYFDTETSGVYTIEYKSDNGLTKTVYVEVKSKQEEDKYPLVIENYLKNYNSYITVPNEPLPLYAKGTSGIDIVGNSVKIRVDIYFEGAHYKSIELIESGITFAFTEIGAYNIKYVATDQILREVESETITLNIARNSIGFNGPNSAHNIVYSSDNTEFFNPSATDINIYDYEYGNNPDSLDVVVKIKKPNSSQYVVFDEDFDFDEKGDYIIRYEYSYEDISGEVERILSVIDGSIPEIHVDGMLANLKTDYRKSSDNIEYLIGTKGATIKNLNVNIFNAPHLNNSLTWIYINQKGESINLTEKLTDENYSLTLDEIGIHTFVFQVKNEQGLIGGKVYEIEIRDSWHVIVVQDGDDKGFTSKNLVLRDFSVLDADGNSVDVQSVIVKIFKDSSQIFNTTSDKPIKIDKPGSYYIEYSLKDFLADSVGYWVEIFDDTPPTIEVLNPVVKGFVNDTINIAKANISDNDMLKDFTVKVSYMGEVVDSYNDKFVPLKEGDYTITYIAHDVSGNESKLSYTVHITLKKFGVIEIVVISLGGVILIAGSVLGVLFFKRKNKLV